MTRKLLMLGFLVSDADFQRVSALDSYPQIAARNLERGFFHGFLDNGENVSVLASAPASTYPLNKKILFGRESWILGASDCQSLMYVNLPGLKALTRFVSTFVTLVAMFSWRRDDGKVLCIYSLHSPYLLAANLINRILGVRYFVIVPDLPEFMSEGLERSWLHICLKRIDRRLIRFLLKRADGASVVADAILKAIPELQKIPSVVIEGIGLSYPENITDKFQRTECQHARPYFVYAGGLNEAYGVGDLVRAFCCSELDAELWLFGKGPLSQMIKEAALHDDRIRYFGFVPPSELKNFQAGATALLLTRPVGNEFVKYSFPSKLLEYMLCGVPVISTKLPGIPREYYQYLTMVEDSPDQIVGALATHLLRSAEERQCQARRALDFVLAAKCPKVQAGKLVMIIDNVFDNKI